VDWRRFHSFQTSTLEPSAAFPVRVLGTTVKAQRVPVKPAFLEKDRNSMAQSLAPSISYMEWGMAGSVINASYAASKKIIEPLALA